SIHATTARSGTRTSTTSRPASGTGGHGSSRSSFRGRSAERVSRAAASQPVDSAAMKILVVGSGGVGSAFAPIAARRDFYEHVVFADYDETRARRIVEAHGPDGRFSAARVDASDPDS